MLLNFLAVLCLLKLVFGVPISLAVPSSSTAVELANAPEVTTTPTTTADAFSAATTTELTFPDTPANPIEQDTSDEETFLTLFANANTNAEGPSSSSSSSSEDGPISLATARARGRNPLGRSWAQLNAQAAYVRLLTMAECEARMARRDAVAGSEGEGDWWKKGRTGEESEGVKEQETREAMVEAREEDGMMEDWENWWCF